MIDVNRLAVVLHHANSQPPSAAKQEFYELKQAILERYGWQDGEDWQKIEHPCWGESRYDPCHEDCGKCGGTGIYWRVFVRLERWRLGDRHVFHRPAERFVALPGGASVTIVGKVSHKRKPLSQACADVLAMLFRPQLYLYLAQFRDVKRLKRFKAVLAYLLGFERTKWQVECIKFNDIAAVSVPF